MARKPRVHYSGAVYHVIARGNNREMVFKQSADKEKYLKLLVKYRQKYAINVLAYVLMNNHIHLLLQVSMNPLSSFMQGIQQSYTQHFNRKYEHVGHVFQQRYKAFLCTDQEYLITLLCYIHQNPVRAGLQEGLNYPWSSHMAYHGAGDSLVNVDFILDYLDSSRYRAIRQYSGMVQNQMEDLVRMSDITRNSPEPERLIANANHMAREEQVLLPVSTWEELIQNIVVAWGIDKDKLIGPCRIRQVVAARNRLIYEAVNHKVCSRSEIALRLNIDAARVTRGYQQALEEERKGKIK